MAYTSDYPIFAVTVDIAIFTVREDRLCALMIRRDQDPFAGELALPGGFVHPDEDLQTAARRELFEETGVHDLPLEQLRSYGTPDRDPRQRVVSVAYVAVIPEAVEPEAGTDAREALWAPVDELLENELAFDHRQILADARERVRSKLEYTTLSTAFVGEEFTLSELRRVYEVIWGADFDAGNFQRKIRHTEDFVVSTGATRPSPVGRGRPAALFRARTRGVHTLSIPITRAQAR